MLYLLRIIPASIMNVKAKKKRQFSTESCRFFLHYSLFVFLSSLFSKHCRFQIRDKREQVVLLMQNVFFIDINPGKVYNNKDFADDFKEAFNYVQKGFLCDNCTFNAV